MGSDVWDKVPNKYVFFLHLPLYRIISGGLYILKRGIVIILKFNFLPLERVLMKLNIMQKSVKGRRF